jgi:dinuclear metal center YbgI/SA1388 family protein
MLTLAGVIETLAALSPPRLAGEWDNVGLLLGDRLQAVSRVMTCLTLTPESAAEAVDRRADVVVSHHPILFKPVKRLTADTAEGRMLLALARAGVAVYSPHTAFDNAAGGINDLLAAKLGLTGVGPLRAAAAAGKQLKLVVFVPGADLARVSDALFAAGAGRIGEYSECSFRLAGTGSFHGSAGSHPAVGQKGRREEVGEWRLEVVCPERNLAEVVSAMRKAHPYEEPAFDLYPLLPAPGVAARSPSEGEGRLGALPQPLVLQELALRVREALASGPVQVVGEPGRQVRRVAVVCGAGGEFLGDAARAGADVFLTGEMRFHDYLAARAQGLALVLPGHYATERCGVEDLAARLGARWPGIEVWASAAERDPASWA